MLFIELQLLLLSFSLRDNEIIRKINRSVSDRTQQLPAERIKKNLC